MVSEKVIVLLLIIAVLLSALSIVLTFSLDISGLRNMLQPNVLLKESDENSARVNLVVERPSG